MTEPVEFADEWISAWNTRDVEAVLVHYADDVLFTSPTATATATALAPYAAKRWFGSHRQSSPGGDISFRRLNTSGTIPIVPARTATPIPTESPVKSRLVRRLSAYSETGPAKTAEADTVPPCIVPTTETRSPGLIP
ncbi:MAG TPA: nuclear transport factor 2 family protein [Acidimicrobiales bacterium]|nr:nuclear transport factor 2 family protein [Acidimicrobiales bacterium]